MSRSKSGDFQRALGRQTRGSESRLKYRVRNSSTGTCKTNKSYNEMNEFGYYLNVLKVGAI